MGLSPTQRTLRALEQRGCLCGIVERFNPYGGPPIKGTDRRVGVRQDLFGIIDIIALYPTQIVGVQSCGQNFAEHDRKILDSPYALEWLKSGGRLELWGWRKIKKVRGGKAMVWQPRVRVYEKKDFETMINEERLSQGLDND